MAPRFSVVPENPSVGNSPDFSTTWFPMYCGWWLNLLYHSINPNNILNFCQSSGEKLFPVFKHAFPKMLLRLRIFSVCLLAIVFVCMCLIFCFFVLSVILPGLEKHFWVPGPWYFLNSH